MTIFQSKEYKELFIRHFISDTSRVLFDSFELLPENRAVLLGMKPVLNGQEITDYGDIQDPTPEHIETLMQQLKLLHGVTTVQFDYIQENSMLFESLKHLSATPPILQEVAPSILLPHGWEEYLEKLERTDRKELKRKIKRLDTAKHEFSVVTQDKNEDHFEQFIKLHKLSDFSKDQFMTDPMKAFFKDLIFLPIPGWTSNLAFLTIEGKPSAAVFYFENEEELLLYNSGYDPEQKYYSAGLLLVAHLIRSAIERGKKTFDFLRGNERYKYDLGGVDKQLFRFLLH